MLVKDNHIYHGNSKEVLKTFPDNYFHSIVTDPPYEIGFMGRKWDSTGIAYDTDFWKECLRVLKPGGHLLSFSATSTYHRMTVAIEDAGFEIRDKIDVFYDGNRDLVNFIDSLSEEQASAFIRLIEQQSNTGLFSWIYGQGMPKGQNISKAIDKMYGKKRPLSKKQRTIGAKDGVYGQGKNWGEIEDIPQTLEAEKWHGWNTGLKPSNEPICIARKPLSEKTVAKNIIKHGTGGFNVDSCRITRQENDRFEYGVTGNQQATTGTYGIYGHYEANSYIPHEKGRFPANVILDKRTADELEKQHTNSSRFFFVSKANKKEREWEEAIFTIKDNLTKEEKSKIINELGQTTLKRNDIPEHLLIYFVDSGETEIVHNNHPTVKPIKLMRELVRLVTPPNGRTLDPFAGSGTTLIALKLENLKFVGIEQSKEYVDISNRRLKAITTQQNVS